MDAWNNIDIDPDSPFPKDEPERDRDAEEKRRQESRINIHQADKSGDAARAEVLRQIEARARNGETTVFPTEYRDDAPSPFDMPTFEKRQEVERQARRVAPPSPFDGAQSVQGNPFESGSGEVLQVLRDMLRILQSIDDKLPQASTYQE